MNDKQREAYVEEKARELYEMSSYADREHGFMYAMSLGSARDFIATIIRECKPKVSREFVKAQSEFLVKRINDECRFTLTYLQKAGIFRTLSEKGGLVDMLHKAKVEVEG